jgi:hypothetical protein
MPLGVLIDRYKAQLERLKDTAAAADLAARTAAGRIWHVPEGAGIWAGDPLDIAGAAIAFNRGAAADLYYDAMTTDKGSVGDAMALKIQSDYLAAQERAWRMRHQSTVRAAMHAAARRLGHSTTTTGALDRVTQYISDLLVAGAAGWTPPTVEAV